MTTFNAKFYTSVKLHTNSSNNGLLYSNGRFTTKITAEDLPDEYVKVSPEGMPDVYLGVDRIIECLEDDQKLYVSIENRIIEYDVKKPDGTSGKKYGGYLFVLKGEDIELIKKYMKMMGRTGRIRGR